MQETVLSSKNNFPGKGGGDSMQFQMGEQHSWRCCLLLIWLNTFTVQENVWDIQHLAWNFTMHLKCAITSRWKRFFSVFQTYCKQQAVLIPKWWTTEITNRSVWSMNLHFSLHRAALFIMPFTLWHHETKMTPHNKAVPHMEARYPLTTRVFQLLGQWICIFMQNEEVWNTLQRSLIGVYGRGLLCWSAPLP